MFLETRILGHLYKEWPEYWVESELPKSKYVDFRLLVYYTEKHLYSIKTVNSSTINGVYGK